MILVEVGYRLPIILYLRKAVEERLEGKRRSRRPENSSVREVFCKCLVVSKVGNNIKNVGESGGKWEIYT